MEEKRQLYRPATGAQASLTYRVNQKKSAKSIAEELPVLQKSRQKSPKNTGNKAGNSKQNSKRKRHTGSDGLRVFALLAVAAFHIRPDIVPGGFLGVVIFLAIAGFYTTRSFVVRPEINLAGYYKKRISRLWPPLLFLLVILGLVTSFFLPEVFRFFQSSAPSAALGVHNVAEIMADKSYFARHGSFDPLTHLWALSLEMQFYLLYPLLYALLSKIGDHFPKKTRLYSREFAGYFLLFLALLSALYMGIAYVPDGDPTPYYYNSLMRVHAFLNGAAFCLISAGRQMRLAFLRETGRLRENKKAKGNGLSSGLRTLLVWLCFLALTASFFLFDANSHILYYGGFYVYSLIACFYLILGGLKPVPGLGFMTSPPFRYLASRSYGIYLWQYALMVVLEAAFRFSTISFWPKLALQLLLVFIFAELSYQIFEAKNLIRQGYRDYLGIILTILLVIILVLPAPRQAKAPELEGDDVLRAIEENESRQEALWSKRQAEEAAERERQAGENGQDKDSQGEEDGEKIRTDYNWAELPVRNPDLVSQENPYGYHEEALDILKNLNLVVIGDSVMAMAMDGLYQYIPNVYIDAAVSRHMVQGAPLIQALDAAGARADILVIALSTNGDINSADLDRLHSVADGRPLIMVNTVVPQSWEQANNQKLAEFVNKHDNVYLADWYGNAKNVPHYFYQDATHPVPEGGSVYSRVILDAVLEALSSGRVERHEPIYFPPSPSHTQPQAAPPPQQEQEDWTPQTPEVTDGPTSPPPEVPTPSGEADSPQTPGESPGPTSPPAQPAGEAETPVPTSPPAETQGE